jgi:hypothetical protein
MHSSIVGTSRRKSKSKRQGVKATGPKSGSLKSQLSSGRGQASNPPTSHFTLTGTAEGRFPFAFGLPDAGDQAVGNPSGVLLIALQLLVERSVLQDGPHYEGQRREGGGDQGPEGAEGQGYAGEEEEGA